MWCLGCIAVELLTGLNLYNKQVNNYLDQKDLIIFIQQ